ncbi:MAG: rRNA maturation RNase YbeY [Phycisphaerales bacterium]|nr:rRNA maturation RNase YbeY [Phycisphaerales bacterium]
MSANNKPFPAKTDNGRIDVRYLRRLPGVPARRIVEAARAALNKHALRSLSVAVVDEATLAELHDHYLNDPSATDVLSFDLRDDDASDSPIEGEVVVSVDAARQQARRLSVDAAEELLRYVIHGVLHLRGYRDDTPARRGAMRRAENRVLANLNTTGDTSPKPAICKHNRRQRS